MRRLQPFIYFFLFNFLVLPCAYSQFDKRTIAIVSALKVRNVQEFIDRFNFDSLGLKSLRDYFLENDSSNLEKLNRRIVLRSIIDPSGRIDSCTVNDFIEFVSDSLHPYYLDYFNSNWYSIADSRFLSGEKKLSVKLYLKNEVHENKASKWVLFNVESERYNVKLNGDSTSFLDPMSYALEFSNLQKIFENRKSMKNIMPSGFKYDALNEFYYDVVKQNIIFKDIGRIQYYFGQVPGWSFIVEYLDRTDNYSGFFITKIQPLTER